VARPVVIVSGKDPVEEIGVGHTVYARAHARAAALAGFEPHVFCVGREAGVVHTEIGLVHRIRSPWPLPPRPGIGYRYHLVWLHAPLLAAAVRRFLDSCPAPHLVHGIGLWGCVGAAVSRSPGRDGGVISAVSAYSTYRHEIEAQRRGLRADHGLGERARFLSRYAWTRAVVERYERRMYAASPLVIVNYESVRRLLDTQYGIGPRCRRLPYAAERAFTGADTDTPSAAARSSGAPMIVAISRHDARKGVGVLLHALARLRARGRAFRARLVGGGSLLDAHRQLAARLGLADVVELPGFVPDSFPHLRAADIFALPSLEEGSGSLSLLEALQAGVAVVASAVDGIPEDVTHGESALLVPPGDADALAGALGLLLSDRDLRQRLARAGREVFVRRFSAAAFAQALGDTYAELGVTPARAPA